MYFAEVLGCEAKLFAHERMFDSFEILLWIRQMLPNFLVLFASAFLWNHLSFCVFGSGFLEGLAVLINNFA